MTEIVAPMLLTSNDMILLVQFGISTLKLLKTTNWKRPQACATF